MPPIIMRVSQKSATTPAAIEKAFLTAMLAGVERDDRLQAQPDADNKTTPRVLKPTPHTMRSDVK